MSMFRTLLVIGATVALGACTNGPGGFGGGGAGGGAGAGGGSVSDPTSPAYFEQTIGDTVLFEVDQSTLTTQGQQTVAAQAAWMMSNGTFTAIVEGHADEQGTREYNLALGARRASAVRDYMVNEGVADNRIQTTTYGKERPIAICSEESCYSQNRRAVTVLSEAPAS